VFTIPISTEVLRFWFRVLYSRTAASISAWIEPCLSGNEAARFEENSCGSRHPEMWQWYGWNHKNHQFRTRCQIGISKWCSSPTPSSLCSYHSETMDSPSFLYQFVEWGKLVVDRLRSVGMWADIMDPASGFPVSSWSSCHTALGLGNSNWIMYSFTIRSIVLQVQALIQMYKVLKHFWNTIFRTQVAVMSSFILLGAVKSIHPPCSQPPRLISSSEWLKKFNVPKRLLKN